LHPDRWLPSIASVPIGDYAFGAGQCTQGDGVGAILGPASIYFNRSLIKGLRAAPEAYAVAAMQFPWGNLPTRGREAAVERLRDALRERRSVPRKNQVQERPFPESINWT